MRISLFISALAFIVLVAHAGIAAGYPENIQNRDQITRASPMTEDIAITFLPVSDYHLLKKFSGVRRVRLWTRNGDDISDDKIIALTRLGLTNVTDIGLLNARTVSDRGFAALTNMPTVKILQLEGTSISDAGIISLTTHLKLNGVNVTACENVTLTGLTALASSGTVTNLGFSATKFNQAEVITLVETAKNVKWWGIVDRQAKLNGPQISEIARQAGARIFIRKTGSLQDMGWVP